MSWSSELDFKLSAFLTKMAESEKRWNTLPRQDSSGGPFPAMQSSADRQTQALIQDSANKVEV